MSRIKKNGHFINVYLDDDLYKKVTAEADNTKRTKTAVIELALVKYFKKKQD